MATLPARMTAIGIKAPRGPEVLAPEERPVPAPLFDHFAPRSGPTGTGAKWSNRDRDQVVKPGSPRCRRAVLQPSGKNRGEV